MSLFSKFVKPEKNNYVELSFDEYCSLASDLIFKFLLEFISPDTQIALSYPNQEKRNLMGIRAAAAAIELSSVHFPLAFVKYKESFVETTLKSFCQNNFPKRSEDVFNVLNQMRPYFEKSFKMKHIIAIRNNSPIEFSAEDIFEISSIIVDVQHFSPFKMTESQYAESVNYISVLLVGLIGSFNEMFSRTESFNTFRDGLYANMKL